MLVYMSIFDLAFMNANNFFFSFLAIENYKTTAFILVV